MTQRKFCDNPGSVIQIGLLLAFAFCFSVPCMRRRLLVLFIKPNAGSIGVVLGSVSVLFCVVCGVGRKYRAKAPVLEFNPLMGASTSGAAGRRTSTTPGLALAE